MFGPSRMQTDVDDLKYRMTFVENTYGMLCPRTASLESHISVIAKKVREIEARLDKDLQRRRLAEEQQ